MHAVMHALCLVCEDPRVQLVFIRVQRPRKDVGCSVSRLSRGIPRCREIRSHASTAPVPRVGA